VLCGEWLLRGEVLCEGVVTYPLSNPILEETSIPTLLAVLAASSNVAPSKFPTRVEIATLTANLNQSVKTWMKFVSSYEKKPPTTSGRTREEKWTLSEGHEKIDSWRWRWKKRFRRGGTGSGRLLWYWCWGLSLRLVKRCQYNLPPEQELRMPPTTL
jgi:hypothetical protein